MFEEDNREISGTDEAICTIRLQTDATLKFINFLDSTVGQQSAADAVRLSLLGDDRNLHNLCLTIYVFKTDPDDEENSQKGAFMVTKNGKNKPVGRKLVRQPNNKRLARRNNGSSKKNTAKTFNEFDESMFNPPNSSSASEKCSKKPKISKSHFSPKTADDSLPLSTFAADAQTLGAQHQHLPFPDYLLNEPNDDYVDAANRTLVNEKGQQQCSSSSSSREQQHQHEQILNLGFVEETVSSSNQFGSVTAPKLDNCDCSICQENRTLPPSLRRAYHRCTIEGCDRVYKTSAHPQHMFYWHQGPKPLTCTYNGCGKTFVRHHDLTRHIRTHTGVKPFVCDTCGKSFIDRGHLVKHIRTHIGGREYECPECKKKFGGPSTLRKHAKTHISPVWIQYPD